MISMEARELRLGNYVTVNNEKYHPNYHNKTLVVTGVEERNNELFPNSNSVIKLASGLDSISQFNEFVNPIPLTEDWLLRFGFEKEFYLKNDTLYLFKKDVLSHGRIGYYPTINTVELGTTGGMNFGKTEIKNVHQLQNLIFTLTGEELTLKTE